MASRSYRDADLEPWISSDLRFYEERLKEARRVRADRPSDLLFLRMEIESKKRDYTTLADSDVPIGIFKGRSDRSGLAGNTRSGGESRWGVPRAFR
jgi:hypothetical protein